MPAHNAGKKLSVALSKGLVSTTDIADIQVGLGIPATHDVTDAGFGAVGDGVTDDTPAIQAAMDVAQPGDTVYLPAGSYLLASAFVAVNTDVKFIGAGIDQTILLRGFANDGGTQGDRVGEQPCIRISTVQKTNGTELVGYNSDMKNIEIAHMTLDYNFGQTYSAAHGGTSLYTEDPDVGAGAVDTSVAGWTGATGWLPSTRLILIANPDNSGKSIENLELHHLKFACAYNDTAGVVGTSAEATPLNEYPGVSAQNAGGGRWGSDCWGVLNSAQTINNRGFKIHNCVSAQEYFQFLGGTFWQWDDADIYENYVYHCRDNGISFASNGAATAANYPADKYGVTNLRIYNNNIVGCAYNAILTGVDGGTVGLREQAENIVITGNTIVLDDFVEATHVELEQCGIVVWAPAMGLKNLVIADNTIIRQSTNTSSDMKAIRVGTLTVQPTYTLTTTFVQPAVGATVAIAANAFTTDPDFQVGTTLHIGEADVDPLSAKAGGRYEVTTAGGDQSYTLTRLPWPSGAAEGLTVLATASKVRLYGTVSNAVISGNTCDGQLLLDWATDTIVSGNIFSGETGATEAIHMTAPYNVIVRNNLINSGEIQTVMGGNGIIEGNIFNYDEPASAGFIQLSSGVDDLGRTPINQWYLSNNRGVRELDASNERTVGLGSYVANLSHELRGNTIKGSTPEASLPGELGMECYDSINDVMYVKTADAGGKTGWVPRLAIPEESVTTGSPTLLTERATKINSAGGAITATLGDGDFMGQLKTITMSNATTPSTVTVTNHEDKDGKVFNFNAFDQILVLCWEGDEWTTIKDTTAGEVIVANSVEANGTFSSDTGWTKGGDWAIADGVATGTTGAISQTPAVALVEGTKYQLTFTIKNWVAVGTVMPSVGGTDAAVARGSNNTFTETITAGAGTDIAFTSADSFDGEIDDVILNEWLAAGGVTSLDSSAGEVGGALGNGTHIGQNRLIVMTVGGTSSEITINNHETFDPEVATFDAADEYWLGVWTGTEWATVSNTCTFV